MKALALLFIIFSSLWQTVWAVPYLIVVSFDGFRHDYMERIPLPVIKSICDNGFRSQSLIPVFPSQTFPSHYSMITGLAPVRHGIVLNRFYDTQTNKLFTMSDKDMVSDTTYFRGIPVWEQLTGHGILTASYHWVGSEAHNPHDWLPYTVGTADSVRTNQLAEWLKRPFDTRPKAYFLYFEFLDDAGHWYGPESAAIDTSLPRTDQIMKTILSLVEQTGLRDSLNLLVVSDHGMTSLDTLNTIDLTPVEEWSAGRYKVLPNYSLVSIYSGQEPHPTAPPSLPGVTWLNTSDLQGSFSYRFGTYLGVAEMGKVFALKGKPLTRSKGGHGYFSSDPDMHGVLFGMGPAFKKGSILPSVNGIDVYALCRYLMALPPDKTADGKLEPFLPALTKSLSIN